MSDKKWFPLESNPEVINNYIKSLGVVGTKIQFCDVFGMDEELLQMVPQPSHAVLFLFPITKNNDEWVRKQLDDIKEKGQTLSENVWFMRQTIGNACGTVGICHALVNNKDKMEFNEGFITSLIKETEGKTPAERAQFLESDDKIEEAQGTAAQQGQTENQHIDAKINLHFICYVTKDGHLYELDGRKPCPVNCGPSSEATLLKDTAAYVKQYMSLDPDELNFTLVSLSSV
eukprot:TRINITY_DN36881_c0_g1_i1.p1 TRINITY_DN36881_c0_g1~~TRINITY_DN36881_c0_g1_i1.p1  ORF type:complete len:231 (+),score=85.38 TRINITY_DN36881_c0_g1_i1:52-744(+)